MSTLMESWPRRHRISAEDYHRMAEIGVLAPDARVELIEGEIIDMAPIGKDHTSVVDQLTRLFVRAVGDDAIVRVQGSVRLSDFSEPEPDLVLLRPRADFYRGRYANGDDTLLVIEVSDSTLRYDRDFKVPFYARHRVPEVWIFDLQHEQLFVYGGLRGQKYERSEVLSGVGQMPIPGLQGGMVDLAGVLESQA